MPIYVNLNEIAGAQIALTKNYYIRVSTKDAEAKIGICNWRISDKEWQSILSHWSAIVPLVAASPGGAYYKRWCFGAGHLKNQIVVLRVPWWERLARWLSHE